MYGSKVIREQLRKNIAVLLISPQASHLTRFIVLSHPNALDFSKMNHCLALNDDAPFLYFIH